MARPRKEGLDYFPHDTDASSDEKIEALRALYGNDGYALYFILLERIYRTATFEIDVSAAEMRQILAQKCGVSVERFEQILESALRWGCFDKGDYETRKVLTSHGIKQRAAAVVEKRRQMQEQYEKRRAQSRKVSASETEEETPPETPQRKEKKSTCTESVPGTSIGTPGTGKSTNVVGGPRRKRGAADPDVKAFIDYYHDQFLSQFGEKPVIDGGKDGAIAKRLLSTYGLEKLKGLLDDFLADDDPWLKKRGYTLGLFKTQINSLLSRQRRHGDGEPDLATQAAIDSTMPEALRRAINGG